MMTATEPALGITGLAQVSINVHDLERATAFYRDRLGLRLLFTAGHMAFFECGGTRLMLALPEKPDLDHPSSILYFSVPDIRAAHARLREAGTEFLAEPHVIARVGTRDVWLAEFRDTEGNWMALMSEVEHAA